MILRNALKNPRRVAQVCASVVLAGLVIYGAVGRAKVTPPGPGPSDTGWKSVSGIKTRAGLSQTKVVRGSDGLVYLQIDLEAPEGTSETGGRKPTDFVIVLDRSGSMADDRKMDFAKKAIDSLISQLKDGDRFALVDFDSDVETPIPLVEVKESLKDRFRSALRIIEPRSGTNLGGGLIRGIQEIKSASKKAGHAQRLVLLSDGLANEGVTDPSELNRIAARAVSGEFAISTIGVGLDFNESLMASLADHGTGNYSFLEDLSSLDKVLAQEFYGASRIFASELKVDLDLASGVEVTDASGYPVDHEGGRFVIRPGHLYHGQKKTLFATLRLPTNSLYTKALGQASLSYHLQGQPRSVVLFGNELTVACLPPEKREEVAASIVPGTFKEAWTKNNYGRLLKDNADKVRSGDRAGALNVLNTYKAKLSEAYAAAPSPEMKKQLEEMPKLESEVNDAFTGPDADEKSKRLSKGYQYQGIQQQRKAN